MDNQNVPYYSSEEDPSMAANILSQFTAVNANRSSQASDLKARKQIIQIIPPTIDNEDDYAFLPGSLKVEEIIDKTNDSYPPKYSTRLASGDTVNLSANLIRTLRNGRNALSQYSQLGPRPPTLSDTSEEGTVGLRRRPSRTRHQKHSLYVNSTTLSLSSDDDPLSKPSTKTSHGARTTRRRSSRIHQTTAPKDSEDETDESAVNGRRRRRRRLPMRPSRPDTDDESMESSSSEPPGRRGQRTRRPRRLPRSYNFDKPQIGVRSSQRVKSLKCMTERLEDDISEAEDDIPQVKYSATKEFFRKLSKDDPFRTRHRHLCNACLSVDYEKGPLIFCQGCTTSYHQKCLGPRNQREHLVTKVGEADFVLQCRRCLGSAHTKDILAPHQGACAQCHQLGPLSKPLRQRMTAREEQKLREENGGSDPITNVDIPLYNVDSILFRCASCERAWHMNHLPPRGENRNPSHSLEESDGADDSEQRFRKYSRRFTCEDCASMPGDIETLVAWRPVDLNSFIPGYTSDMMEEIAKEYLIKWRKKSYFQTSWMPGPWVWAKAAPATRKAFSKSSKSLKPIISKEDAIPEEFLRVDIIFDLEYSNVVSNSSLEIDMARVKEVSKIYVKYKGLPYEDAVWETIPSPKETERWHDYQMAYQNWVAGKYVRVPKSHILKKNLATARSKDFATQLVKKTQPPLLTGGQIMDYQKDGLNWLYYMWYKEQNAILADEMGLGKTIQVIALLATLVHDHRCWPFLVVVPNSTCPNWRREIKVWAPKLRVVTYYGSSAARKIAHDYEMFPDGSSDLRCHIVVTSYESMIDETARRLFSNIPWAGLVVDEGQRLKNDKNLLYEALTRINFPFKILLTGTPLQNNIRELFNIIQFCDPSKNAEALEQQYGGDFTKETLTELHDMIRPYFLRRTKAQVLTFLPPMAQIILPVTMSVVQKKLYKSILAKNPQLIQSIFKKTPGGTLKRTEHHNLNNILMQLRKCLCHPFVYSKAIEERAISAALSHRNLVEASSKLQLLEMLLPKLQERGHRVLIFSQFLDNLDVVEDFLDGLGLLHRRLDGSMSSLQKQKQIDDFNAPDSPYFAFLLSTRSGGVGINLATADTVIIMDPDFNPHQDIQALSRAHRIGQRKKVLVFQLVTKGSAEEKIMQIGKKKMALDQVLIEHMDAEDDTEVDLEAILRHGADALFDDATTDDIHYDNESIEKLLDRSQIENTKAGDDGSAESQFSFARVWVNDTLSDKLGDSETATPNDTVWNKILQERERIAAEEAKANAQALGRGKRKRQTVDYAFQYRGVEGHLLSSPKASGKDDTDAEFQSFGPESDPEDADTDGDFVSESRKSGTGKDMGGKQSTKVRPFKRTTVPDVSLELDSTMDGSGESSTTSCPVRRCVACDQIHQTGHCPLKLAGVEHCGLCGIAHYGRGRTCPHLNSETQVALMLGSLKESPEQRALVDEATKYLRGIRGDLVRRKKLKLAKGKEDSLPQAPPPPPIFHPAQNVAAYLPANPPLPSHHPDQTNTASHPYLPRSLPTHPQQSYPYYPYLSPSGSR
ncbi:chromatin remodeling complex subunit [Blastomyces gilchristii SLH14081]|uniref:Chromatin remodeling complex subunit n=1 Tax=Blastomyces gilchristii (strain SLH14081) TaxID=559298 RepID=A0A179UKQ6_BLAGS|nr:chromatin remodeling complex subunit [Blastomyces gilchristii SLH14081]OAT08656.1 chromatin remodeling complex subunit [Blastomyces gilchristii SLH14081]